MGIGSSIGSLWLLLFALMHCILVVRIDMSPTYASLAVAAAICFTASFVIVLLHSFNVYDRKLPNGICCVCASPIGMLVVPVSVFLNGVFISDAYLTFMYVVHVTLLSISVLIISDPIV